MIFDHINFPILEMLEREDLKCDSLRFYNDDYYEQKMERNSCIDEVKRKTSLTIFLQENGAMLRKAFKACKDNAIYITSSKLLEMLEYASKPSKALEDYAACFIFADSSRMPHSVLCYKEKGSYVHIHMVQQSVAGIYVMKDENPMNVWLSKHFTEEQKDEIFSYTFFLAEEYKKYLKDEISVFGKELLPGKSLRLPNEISQFINKTKTKITIIN